MKTVYLTAILMVSGFIPGLKAQDTASDSLYNQAHDLYRQAKYEQAADLFKEASESYLSVGDSADWALSILRQGDAFLNQGEVRKGEELFIYVSEHHPRNAEPSLKAQIFKNLGRVYRQMEQYEKSTGFYQKSIDFAAVTKDSSLIAQLNNNISYPYLYSGDYEKAFSYQKKAKEIYESIGEEYNLSFVLNGMFLTLRNLGLHKQANKYIRHSMDIRERKGNPDFMDVAYHNMAVSFNDMGQTDSAIIYYGKSLELSRMLENPYDITQTLINIGQLYKRSGEYDNALAYFNEALETNYQTERPRSIANNLKELAEVAILNDDLNNADSFYREALNWMKKVDSPQELAELYVDIAGLKLKQDKFGEAKEYVEEAKDISMGNYALQQSKAHTVLAEIYEAQGAFRKSVNQYRRAYTLYTGQSISSQIEPTINLAGAYSKIESDSAFTLADKAFALIDTVRTNVAGLTFRSGFFRDYAGFYNEVASWYVTQKNDPEKAFDLVEAAKARVLMDELAEARKKVYETLDEATLIKKQQKAKQIDRLYSQLEQADSKEGAAAIREELKDLEFEYQSFLNELHLNSRELKNFDYPRPVTLGKVQELLNKETAVVEYAFTHTGIIRLVVQRDNISASYIDSVSSTDARSFFTEHVRRFRQSITESEEKSTIYEQGSNLYDYLIPAFEEVEGPKTANLVIIPDGPLSFLPFEALSRNTRYLIQDFQVKYLPSASIYSFIQPPHRDTEYDLLALAGSGFESEESAAYPARSQASFASLPSTLLEVDSISVNFSKVKVLKNDDVTEATLKSHNLGNYRILHFATHANVDETNPFRSGLILSKKAEVESLFGEDGHLNSREISSLKLNADLVTLSACNTGMGKLVTGEGLLGLQRSFLSAGASSVMVSLWSVFDRSTSVFMSNFYSSMLAHQQEDYGMWNQTLDWFGMYEHPMIDYKTKAIRDAKLAMIDHPYYNHPVYWAPFILIGK
ncbi:MAG: CHAT domain-containing protein [Gracilimonas sp.]|uniref:CHAT domain-containing protein n=1 Tax=Gracilimonas TaxID=649462 RepID=UPI001B19A96C|nr:CHAT domain-containing protein [Gracilimonas sp.]MBO6584727.1 CHAT domain-containing protein [Gracilimonas sp.]MBO6616002.1 CHAT domain-containing protein [Gracilimonas sp.]